MKIENLSIYHISERSRVVIASGSKSVTIFKRINPMMEASIKLNRAELETLFQIIGLRDVIDGALKIEGNKENATDKSE